MISANLKNKEKTSSDEYGGYTDITMNVADQKETSLLKIFFFTFGF